jgi:type IV secretory pathway TrbL component
LKFERIDFFFKGFGLGLIRMIEVFIFVGKFFFLFSDFGIDSKFIFKCFFSGFKFFNFSGE